MSISRFLSSSVCLLAVSAAGAATVNWNVNTNGSWLTGTNWAGGNVPGAEDMAYFTGNSGATVFDIDFAGATNHGAGNQIVGEIFLGGTANRTIGAGTATNGTLTLAGVAGVLLGSNSGYTLTLAKSVNSATGVMTTVLGSTGTIDIANSGSIIVSTDISDNGNGYGLSRTGTGTGTLMLNGNNTYTGATAITGGVLQYGDGTSNTVNKGLGSSVGVSAGGVLNLARLHSSTNQNVTWTLPSITLSDGGTMRFTASTGSNAHNVAADVTVSGNTTINNTGGGYNQTIVLSGKLSGSGTITYLMNTNSGSQVGASRELALTNASTDFAGHWIVSNSVSSTDDFATLRSGAVGSLGTGTVTLGARAVLTTSLNNGLNSLSGIALTTATSALNTGNYTWQNTGVAVSLTAGIVSIGTATTQIGTLNGSGGTVQSAGGTSLLQVGGGSYSGILANGSGTLGVTMYGAGNTLTLGGVNTYTGTTSVSAGTLAITGTVRINGTGGIVIASGATLSLGGTLVATSGTDTLANAGAFTAGGTLNLNGLFDTYNGGTDGTYTLVTGSGTKSGTFAGVTGYNTSVWSNVVYNDGMLTFTAVPEPSVYGLLGAGALAGAAAVRRRRKR